MCCDWLVTLGMLHWLPSSFAFLPRLRHAGLVHCGQAEYPDTLPYFSFHGHVTPYTCPVTTLALPHALDPLKPYFFLHVKHLVYAPNLECVL